MKSKFFLVQRYPGPIMADTAIRVRAKSAQGAVKTAAKQILGRTVKSIQEESYGFRVNGNTLFVAVESLAQWDN